MNKSTKEFWLIQARLREAITNSAYTLSEISEKTNIPLSTLKGYMTKDRLPNMKRFFAICVVLDISADDILNLK